MFHGDKTDSSLVIDHFFSGNVGSCTGEEPVDIGFMNKKHTISY